MHFSRGPLEGIIHTYVAEQVAMFLHVVVYNHWFRVIYTTFRRSMETIFHHFNQVLYEVGELRRYDQATNWSHTSEDQEQLQMVAIF
jgi:hypothetical protein